MKNRESIKSIVINQAKYTRLIPMLVGPSGVGKTALVQSIADDLGLKLFTLNLASIESSDFSGRAFTNSKNQTEWAKPKFLDHEGIIFLDEINRVFDESVKSALHSLLLDRKINGHELPKNTLLIAAGNKGEGFDIVDFDISLNERIIEIELIPDLNDWKNFESKTRPSELVSFLASSPDLVQKFSFRRMTEANKFYLSTKSVQGLEYILSESLVELFNDFLHSKSITLAQVLSGDFSTKEVKESSALSLVVLSHDLAKSVLTEIDSDKLANAKKFIALIPNEAKLTFFSDIKAASDSMEHEKFKVIAERLKANKFFSGELKDYLSVIFE